MPVDYESYEQERQRNMEDPEFRATYSQFTDEIRDKGYELLVRWSRPVMAQISPDYLPVFKTLPTMDNVFWSNPYSVKYTCGHGGFICYMMEGDISLHGLYALHDEQEPCPDCKKKEAIDSIER